MNVQETVSSETAAYTYQPAAWRRYPVHEVVFAWFLLFCSFFFCRFFPVYTKPIGGFILSIVSFASCYIMLIIKKKKPCRASVAVSVSAVILSLSLFLTSNQFLQLFTFGYVCASICYFLYAAFGNPFSRGLSDMTLIDYFKAVFIMPVLGMGDFFRAAFSGRSAKGGKVVLKIAIGVLIAFIPTAAVMILLSYDQGFSSIMSDIYSAVLPDTVPELVSWILSAIFAFPVAVYLFGIFISSSDDRGRNVITREECSNGWKAVKKVPVSTSVASVVPMLIIYVIFFISQWDYYVSAFRGVLPEGTVYSEYAREGFFQLCAVSVINLLVILFISVFMKREGKGSSAALKTVSVVYSLTTLVLIATAFSKMMMYIRVYGLTPKRAYVSCFEIFLALAFIFIILKQIFRKINAAALSAAALVLLFGALSVCDLDAVIARYNVDRFLEGSLDKVDVSLLDSLGDSGIPEEVRLFRVLAWKENSADGLNEKESDALNDLRSDIRVKLYKRPYLIENNDPDDSWLKYTVPRIRAVRSVRGILSDTEMREKLYPESDS
ncbi:MAG: DUF4173 domain-containing protein [Clostridia bacterium]|nr:DUF4173 domain-containing protein [Clostridia bacterium]